MHRKKSFALGIAAAGIAATIFLLRRSKSRTQQETGDSGVQAPNQSLYHLYAPLYDRLFRFPYASARRRAVDLLELQPGERLLISGVGTGLDLPQIPAGVEGTGVDISIEMLQQAAQKSSQANIQLLQMDAQNLDLPAESFDAALLNLIVSVAPDGHAVFQEAWRMLKPGGRLVLFDKFIPEDQVVGPLRSLLGSLFRWIGTDINRRLSDVLGNIDDGSIEINEPSLFFGQYRILKLQKGVENVHSEKPSQSTPTRDIDP